MLRRILGALGFWLGVFEGLASRAGLRGLSWGDWWVGLALSAVTIVGGRPRPLGLVLALPMALVLQVGLAAARRHRLNPKLRLAPGVYGDRVIERIDIAGRYGAVPALHIVPVGGAQAAVCVAHGSGCDKTFYAWRLVDDLVARGLAVLLIDLDGHGESPRPQAFPDILESVGAPARWLRERYARVGLLGLSLGGAVTACAAAEGAPCDALVLWAVPPRLRLTPEEYQRVRRIETLRIARPTLVHLFRDGTAYHVALAWQTTGIRARIGTWDLFEALDLLGSLKRVAGRDNRSPLLLIYAGRDGVLPQGASDEVQAATRGWGQFHLLTKASHVSLPVEPETIAVTGQWLEEVLNAQCTMQKLSLRDGSS